MTLKTICFNEVEICVSYNNATPFESNHTKQNNV